ncbi:DEAD/DEAH box helicase [Alcaligenes faecalis]|uniref:DEAD/DEAH box helicase n=1 Tax=Alcaligenes faecalis TaxID=511 RepID=UPI000F68F57C|nr:DEAD/DEAH box helicase [Alcaligenes faecalis]MBQ0216457.1 DEAD/DEAH box helicase [Alcaligenes faecalis]RSE62667.1 DEAD/DEAH box helicase [Alcaligenes faecalis]
MATGNQDRLAAAEQIRRELALENQLSRPQAKAYVRCLQTTWQVPVIQWGDKDSARQLNDARRLLQAAHIFRSIEGPASIRALECFRRTGEVLEWLSRAYDDIRTIIPIDLLAAGAYQLGGLPAMAAGLIAQAPLEHMGVVLYAAFLRADFDHVLRKSAEFWSEHPDLTSIDATVVLLQHQANAEQDGVVAWLFTVELVRALGLTADSLRRGDDSRLSIALTKLRALDTMATRSFSDDTALVISIVREVAEEFSRATIYRPLRALAETRPQGTEKLLTYARDQYSRGRGILWSSQLHGLERLLTGGSFALCTPTGSGKTLVANIALIKELLLSEGGELVAPLALYLVPSRALAGEVEAKLNSELGEEITITGLYGGADWGITDNWLLSDKPVTLIATVEKADALLRYLGPLLLVRLKLLVIDEAHQVVPTGNDVKLVSFSDHANRSIRLESLISRILAYRPDVVRIALTAVAGGASGPVARWVEGRADAQAVGTRYRSTRQLIGVLETVPNGQGRILLDLMNGLPLYLRGEEDPVYLPLRIGEMPSLPAIWRNSLNRFNCLNVLWTALHLAEEDQRILISVMQEPEKTMRWFKEALGHKDWQDIIKFSPPDGPLRARFNEARAACIDYCGLDSFELFLLDHGIATSHGQMPQRLRRLMVEMIEKRICPITVATATLTEGVNLPFDLIFLTSLKRRSWDPVEEKPEVTPTSTSEFRNLAGRAGRPGTARGIEGMTLIALPTHISTTAPGQRATQVQQKAQLANDYENLRASLLVEEQEHDTVSSPITTLLQGIWERASNLLKIGPDAFLNWLETTAPTEISSSAGAGANDDLSRLADAMDELDGLLLSSLEELAKAEGEDMVRSRAEHHLAQLWRATFSAVAAKREAWLEHAFIRRGAGIIEYIYVDPRERRRLYHYGFPPVVGRRFEAIAEKIREALAEAEQYGHADATTRIDVFQEIGELLVKERGFGFRVRRTDSDEALLERWIDILGWWLNEPNVGGPEPESLRAWQRFVTDNLEFRLGTAIGAIVARAWAEGTENTFAVPSLSEWKQTTGLPWFGFWARELLRWGTHDPFVAFCLSQGLAQTREAATTRRKEYDEWLSEELDDVTSEDLIDPQLFLRWQRSFPKSDRTVTATRKVNANVTGTNGSRGRYAVMPIVREDSIAWLDPAGFELAVSNDAQRLNSRALQSDYELQVEGEVSTVTRLFRPARR